VFAVRRYTNPEGESAFVPEFNGVPSQPVPSGYTAVKDAGRKEGSEDILKKANIPSGVSAESILIKEGLMAPRKDKAAVTTADVVTKPEVDTTTTSLTQPDKQDENRIMSTEPPEVVPPESVDRLTSQLKAQYNAIKQSSGYKYKNEKELDYIFNNQARQLASYGINDIRDVGVEEVAIDPTQRTIRNIRERDGEYFYLDESSDNPTEIKIDPASIQDLRKTEVDEGDAGISTRIEADILEGGGTQRYLINKVTGKRIKTREDTGGLTNRGWGNRWGWDNSVEGSVDFGVEFVDGNAIFMPVYKSTKTDLTPLMMIASVALMAAGVPPQIGGTLAPAAAPATQAAIGQAVVAGGMTALSGGDFEDIAKAAVLSGGMSYVSAGLPQMSTSIGESILGPGAVGAKTLGTAITTAGVNGVAAAILGQDVGKAMLAGAVSSAVQLNASDFLKSTFGEDAFNKLASATNLSEKQMEGLVVRSLSKGAGAMAYNKNFFTGFRNNLINEGLSLSAANAATKAMSGKMDKKQLAKVHRTVRKTASLVVLAKQRGLDVSTVLQSAYPRLILDTMKD
jgi:hypothetical protein